LRADVRPWNTCGDPDAIGRGQPPPMMFCPDCHTNLNFVPADAPCPNCGGRRRSATVTARVADVQASASAVTMSVGRAVDSGQVLSALQLALILALIAAWSEQVVQDYAGWTAETITVAAVVVTVWLWRRRHGGR
jgi:hypothetical protein